MLNAVFLKGGSLLKRAESLRAILGTSRWDVSSPNQQLIVKRLLRACDRVDGHSTPARPPQFPPCDSGGSSGLKTNPLASLSQGALSYGNSASTGLSCKNTNRKSFYNVRPCGLTSNMPDSSHTSAGDTTPAWCRWPWEVEDHFHYNKWSPDRGDVWSGLRRDMTFLKRQVKTAKHNTRRELPSMKDPPPRAVGKGLMWLLQTLSSPVIDRPMIPSNWQ